MKRILKKEQGLTLLELMVSLAIGVILLLALGAIYLTALQSNKKRSIDEMLDETARQVFDQFEHELSMAGYLDIFDVDANGKLQAENVARLSAANVQRNFSRDISNAGTPVTPFKEVFNQDGISGTDSELTVRYQVNVAAESSATNLRDEANAGDNRIGCTGANVAAGTKVVENTYSLKNSALYCKSNNARGDEQSIVANIHSLSFRYLVTDPMDTQDATLFDSPSGLYIANTLTHQEVAQTPLQWAGVTAVEVCIVAGSDQLTGNAGAQITTFQPSIPSCNRDDDGNFVADTARPNGDFRMYRRYVETFNIPNSLYFLPGELQ